MNTNPNGDTVATPEVKAQQTLEPITRQIRPGIYRNDLGAEIEVTNHGIGSRPPRLGDIWNARSVDPLFGPEALLVTTEGLISCGYQRVVTAEEVNDAAAEG